MNRLHGACHAGRLEVVKFLVAQGVEVESPNKLGQVYFCFWCLAMIGWYTHAHFHSSSL